MSTCIPAPARSTQKRSITRGVRKSYQLHQLQVRYKVVENVLHDTVPTKPHKLPKCSLVFRDLLDDQHLDLVSSNTFQTHLETKKQLRQDLATLRLPYRLNNLWNLLLDDSLQVGLEQSSRQPPPPESTDLDYTHHEIRIIDLLPLLLLRTLQLDQIRLIRDTKGCEHTHGRNQSATEGHEAGGRRPKPSDQVTHHPDRGHPTSQHPSASCHR